METSEKQEIKQIELTSASERVIRSASQRLNQLAAAAKHAQELHDEASGIHQQHLVAIIESAGFKADDFQGYGLWSENGKTYLRARPRQ